MRVRKGHRHIHVIDTGVVGSVKNGFVEAWVAGIHNQIYFVIPRQLFNHLLLASIDEFDRKSLFVLNLRLNLKRAIFVVIRENHLLQPGSLGCHYSNRLTHTANSNQQYFHDFLLYEECDVANLIFCSQYIRVNIRNALLHPLLDREVQKGSYRHSD